MAGTMFDKSDDEYYVILDNFGSNANQYSITIVSQYLYYNEDEDAIPLFVVDMENGLNVGYVGEESNTNAQSSEDLSINGTTLIKVVNGKNVLYLEGTDAIKEELLG